VRRAGQPDEPCFGEASKWARPGRDRKHLVVGNVGADHEQVEVGLVHPGSKIDGIDDALLSDNAPNRLQIIGRLKGKV